MSYHRSTIRVRGRLGETGLVEIEALGLELFEIGRRARS